LKARGVIAWRSERERKKAVEALEMAGNFIPLDMLEGIPDPERTAGKPTIMIREDRFCIEIQYKLYRQKCLMSATTCERDVDLALAIQ
jgi:hypothetical protein